MMSKSWRSACLVALLTALSADVLGADPIIGFSGTAGVRLGTPLSKIRVLLEQPIKKFDQQPSGHCFYASPKNDRRYSLMFIDDVLARIDVDQPGIRTSAGVGVGDPVAKVREVYGQALKDEPDFYDDRERYLTTSSGDGRHAIRFMTHEGKVFAILAGTAKSVRYVEGCL